VLWNSGWQDNPADFSYFFDTSRRRTCYIAPERFVESSWRTVDPTKDMSNLDLTTSEVKKGDLTPSMDIFSTGSVCIFSISDVVLSQLTTHHGYLRNLENVPGFLRRP